MLQRAQSSLLQNTGDLEDEDEKERHTLKLHLRVLEDGCSRGGKGKAGESDKQRKFMFCCDKYNSSLPLFKTFQ